MSLKSPSGELSINFVFYCIVLYCIVFQRLFYERSFAEIASQLFVCPETIRRTVSTFLNTGDVKPCNIGRPTGSVSLIPHEEYIIMDYDIMNSTNTAS